jgi:hypothetical protein
VSSLPRPALWFLWGAAALACSPSVAEESSAPAQLREALSGGQIERDYSGTLALVTVTRELVELCTVTLLAPNLVATARHCVAPTSADSVRCDRDPASFDAPYPTNSLWVNRGRALRDSLVSYGLLPTTGGGDELVAVDEVFVPETEAVCGGDLALLLLAENLSEDEAEPIAPRLDDPVESGERYTAIGFGATPDPDLQGVRRSRSGLQVTCTPESCEGVAAVEDTEFRGGDGVCFGDSGGPAIDADGLVTGIASRSIDCTGSVYSALSRWRDFVRDVAEQAAGAGDYPEPEWLVEAPPKPKPSPEEAAEEEPEAGTTPVASSTPSQTPAADESDSDGSDDDDGDSERPVVSSVGGGGSGCSLARASTSMGAQPSWQPLVLLLGLALGCHTRSRHTRSRHTRSRRAGAHT